MQNAWIELMPDGMDLCGFIPGFLDVEDDRPAREQLDAAYAHGGGWRTFEGFEFLTTDMTLRYPGDPPMKACAFTHLPKTDESVIVFEHAWVAIVQKDQSFEVARMD